MYTFVCIYSYTTYTHMIKCLRASLLLDAVQHDSSRSCFGDLVQLSFQMFKKDLKGGHIYGLILCGDVLLADDVYVTYACAHSEF